MRKFLTAVMILAHLWPITATASVGVAGVIGVIGTAVVAGIGFKLIARKPKKDGN